MERTSDAIETLREALLLLPDAPSPLRQLLQEHLVEFEAVLSQHKEPQQADN